MRQHPGSNNCVEGATPIFHSVDRWPYDILEIAINRVKLAGPREDKKAAAAVARLELAAERARNGGPPRLQILVGAACARLGNQPPAIGAPVGIVLAHFEVMDLTSRLAACRRPDRIGHCALQRYGLE